MPAKKKIPTVKESQENEPRLADIIEKNIRTIIALRQTTATERSFQERMADLVTDFSGRVSFVFFHVIWFGIWIALNLGVFGLKPFDPYPFGLLTMVVSLEAIFLSTFVLISQNRLSAEADRRADLALQMGILTEYELTRTLKMLDDIQDKLGIDNDSDQELLDLEKNVRPEDVLAEIERMQQKLQTVKKKHHT